MNNKLTLILATFCLILTCASTHAQQVTLDIKGNAPASDAARLFAWQGVIFESKTGKPDINKDIDGVPMLCARAWIVVSMPIIGDIRANRCEDFIIRFVDPNNPLKPSSASNITITIRAVGGVRATVRLRNGRTLTGVQPLIVSSNLKFTVPEQTLSIVLEREDPSCIACSFAIREMSFTPLIPPSPRATTSEPGCRPTNGEKVLERLLNENYSSQVFSYINSYNRGGTSAGRMSINYLKPGQATYLDEYFVLLSLPERIHPSVIVGDMVRGLDTVGTGPSAVKFKSLATFNLFRPQNDGHGIGDVYQVKPPTSPFSGDLMTTGAIQGPEAARFRLTALTNRLPQGSGEHVMNGSREFGFENYDGEATARFYVRGAFQDRGNGAGTNGQKELWLLFMQGLAHRVRAEGGRIIMGPKMSIDERFDDLPPCYIPLRSHARTEPTRSPVQARRESLKVIRWQPRERQAKAHQQSLIPSLLVDAAQR
jgi:hypothetical protein